jgi:hypothetical protein
MNKINKNSIFLIFITICIVLVSCEGGTTFIKTIDNRSSETIVITLFTAYGSNIADTIRANESKEIYWDDQMGRFVDDSYCCTEVIDSVEITITNNKTLIKDIMDSGNWIRKSEGGRNSMENCSFIITDTDLL